MKRVIAAAVVIVIGWSSARAAEKDDSSEVVAANNAFGVELYGKLKDAEGNLLISPVALASGLSMLSMGARGTAAEEMAKVLHLPADAEAFHRGQDRLRRDLQRRKRVTLTLACALWGQKGVPFEKGFLDDAKRLYAAGFEEVDLQGAREDALKRINGWVARMTRNRIKDAVRGEDVDKRTRLFMTSAVFFEGKWRWRFPRDRTKDAPFKLSAEEALTVPMMQTKEMQLPWMSGKGFDAVELPYSGEELSMVVFVPGRVDGLTEFEKSLTLEKLEGWLKDLKQGAPVTLFLPRLNLATRHDMTETLKAAGMAFAFDEEADFSGIAKLKDGFYLHKAVQSAVIEVDEDGTRVAVAFQMPAGVWGDHGPDIRADHPFFFLIRDRKTGSILFMGRVVNPKEAGSDADADALAAAKVSRAHVVRNMRVQDDKVTAVSKDGRLSVTITSPGGIGGATIERGEGDWPDVVRVELRYKELKPFEMLEMFRPAFSDDGKDGVAVEYHRVEDEEHTMMVEFSPGRLAGAKELRLEWIDAYR